VIRTFIKYWVPVLLWMAVIFSASADASSGPRSSRIIGPVVRWLIPNISDKALDTVVYTVRKTAHLTEYAILALLLYRAFNRHGRSHPMLLAFALAAIYAVTDELHQSFVPNRQGQPLDVLIDSTGAALGLAALWLVQRWRKAKPN
jgi:VanZ family protein